MTMTTALLQVDSRRSSGELAGHSGQQSSSVLARQMFFENMSPISEISSSSSMVSTVQYNTVQYNLHHSPFWSQSTNMLAACFVRSKRDAAR